MFYSIAVWCKQIYAQFEIYTFPVPTTHESYLVDKFWIYDNLYKSNNAKKIFRCYLVMTIIAMKRFFLERKKVFLQ